MSKSLATYGIGNHVGNKYIAMSNEDFDHIIANWNKYSLLRKGIKGNQLHFLLQLALTRFNERLSYKYKHNKIQDVHHSKWK